MYIASKWKPELVGASPSERAKIYQMLTLIYSAFVDKLVMPGFKKESQTELYADAVAGITPIIERLERQ